MLQYNIRRTTLTPELCGLWDGPAWGRAPALAVAWFHPKSSDHRPVTRAKLLYDEERLYVIFRVEDRYVRSVRTQPHDNVCRDSCVELFVQPHADRGYFNFEWNCGGTVLLHYNETAGPGRRSAAFGPEWLARVPVYHSMPAVVEPEMAGPVTWTLEFAAPFALFESVTPPVRPVAGTAWRANLYKCGSETSHPHWASWSPLGEELSFHRPETFGELRFAR